LACVIEKRYFRFVLLCGNERVINSTWLNIRYLQHKINQNILISLGIVGMNEMYRREMVLVEYVLTLVRCKINFLFLCLGLRFLVNFLVCGYQSFRET
jgi:hypothetical protein